MGRSSFSITIDKKHCPSLFFENSIVIFDKERNRAFEKDLVAKKRNRKKIIEQLSMANASVS